MRVSAEAVKLCLAGAHTVGLAVSFAEGVPPEWDGERGVQLGQWGELSAGHRGGGVAAHSQPTGQPAWDTHRCPGSSQVPQRSSRQGRFSVHLGLWPRWPPGCAPSYIRQLRVHFSGHSSFSCRHSSCCECPKPACCAQPTKHVSSGLVSNFCGWCRYRPSRVSHSQRGECGDSAASGGIAGAPHSGGSGDRQASHSGGDSCGRALHLGLQPRRPPRLHRCRLAAHPQTVSICCALGMRTVDDAPNWFSYYATVKTIFNIQVCDTALVNVRSVTSMRQRVMAVAAANRHTVVLAEGGTVYSWGSNLQGQLGYGTSDSASNAVPRIVEAMKVCPQMPALHVSLHIHSWRDARIF